MPSTIYDIQEPLRSTPVVPNDGGWHKMEQVMRDVDKQKIKDSKEDIDTILVFVRSPGLICTSWVLLTSRQAGLFSGISTAFLVEAYKTLQPDPTSTMISLLQQIASQTSSFTLNENFLNSTLTPRISTSSSFQPPLHAKTVNILWFTSLVLNLMTASFGITVKYWLRAFLSGEYTSPQARLRVRHFRFPTLSKWRVFEISSVLPLLIQISLALFLIGLCYFTADVHRSVGHATLALVAAWAFVFVAFAFMPIYDAACPFKTPFLETSWISKALWYPWDVL